MTDQQIQYCTTTDGVSIAYIIDGAGSGVPVISALAPPLSHVRESHWQGLWPSRPRSETRRVAEFDFRGCGLSERHIEDFSMDALTFDLNAVVERLGWPRFALYGAGMSGPIVIKYAAEHPERVTSLVLRETYARAAEMGRIPRMRALGALLREDWDSYLSLMALTMFGWDPNGGRLAEFFREATTPELVRAFTAATPTYNASAFVDKVAARTLVIGRDDMPVPSGDMLRQLGARIRDARVVMVTGSAKEWINAADVIERFLAEGDDVPAVPDTPRARGMAVVLFMDVVDSTGLTERMGDEAYRGKGRALDEWMRAAIQDAGGAPVDGKVLGDGLMAVFDSAAPAIEAARRCVELSEECDLQLHAGLHAGDVIHEAGNVYGGAVNIASRVCAASAPGEILVSTTVRDLARTSAGVRFIDRGGHALKGIDDAVRLYEVRWRADRSPVAESP